MMCWCFRPFGKRIILVSVAGCLGYDVLGANIRRPLIVHLFQLLVV
ncbi:hypothetical protein [uncultured Gammaproteobacteria bacterium]|nr:hypothetical protein [uncultured Gammaproteobacteria bacterium]